MLYYLKLLRPHHWSKNLLILLPAIAGGLIFQANSPLPLIYGIILFSLCASCGYIFNDLCDIAYDRTHHRKKFRPIAAGKITPTKARLLLCIGLSITAIGALLLSPAFALLLLCYFLSSGAYSLFLKRLIFIDLICLVGLYTYRVYAGILLSPAKPTAWLFLFITSLFLSLAALKRYGEIRHKISLNLHQLPGRGYSVKDGSGLQITGVASGIFAAGTLISYTRSTAVLAIYESPLWLLILPLALAVWLNRAWILASRNKMHSDPIVYAFKDPSTYVIGVVCLIAMMLAYH